MSLLFTNLTPISKQIKMAQYIIDNHSNYDGKVIEVKRSNYKFNGVTKAIIVFEKGTAVDEMAFISGPMAEALFSIK